MDKIKKYLKDHEEHLSVDKISEDVWFNVYHGINKNPSFFSKAFLKSQIGKLKSHLISQTALKRNVSNTDRILRRPANSVKWAFALILPLVLVFSCTYRVDRVEAIGSLISFDIIKNNIEAMRQVTFLQQTHRLNAIRFDKEDKIHESFLSFIDGDKRREKIVKEVKQLAAVSSINVIPVKATINESLFSIAVHKAFKVHVDVKKPEQKEVQRLVQRQLDKLGFAYVKVSIMDGEVELGMDKVVVTTTSVQPDSIQAVVQKPEAYTAADKVPDAPAQADTLVRLTQNVDTTATPLVKSETTLQAAPSVTGKWTGQLKEDTLTVKFHEPKPDAAKNGGWVSAQKFSIRDIGLTTLSATAKKPGNVHYDIERESGTVKFKVIVLNTNGYGNAMVQDAVGTYIFKENGSFREFLNQNGFENLGNELLFLLFVTNTDKQTVLDLKAKDFTTSSKLEEHLRAKL